MTRLINWNLGTILMKMCTFNLFFSSINVFIEDIWIQFRNDDSFSLVEAMVPR